MAGKMRNTWEHVKRHKKKYIAAAAGAAALGTCIGYIGSDYILSSNRDRAAPAGKPGAADVDRAENRNSDMSYFFNADGEFIIPAFADGVVIGDGALDYRVRQISNRGVVGTAVLGVNMTHSQRENAVDAMKKKALPEIYMKAFGYAKARGLDGFKVDVNEVRSENKVTLEAMITYTAGVE